MQYYNTFSLDLQRLYFFIGCLLLGNNGIKGWKLRKELEQCKYPVLASHLITVSMVHSCACTVSMIIYSLMTPGLSEDTHTP